MDGHHTQSNKFSYLREYEKNEQAKLDHYISQLINKHRRTNARTNPRFLQSDHEYDHVLNSKAKWGLNFTFLCTSEGFDLIHELLWVYGYNGHINVKNQRVLEILKRHGIGDLRNQRNKDIIQSIEELYVNANSYLEKLDSSDKSTHEIKTSIKEIVSYNILNGEFLRR